MTKDIEQSKSEIKHEYFKQYIDKLNDIKIENERLLARNTLIISGGAFTLSVTLLKEVYTNPLPWTKAFLIASWVLFGLCAFLQFYSDHLSSLAIDIQRKNYTDCYPENLDQLEKLPNKYTVWVRFINLITPWIICLGFMSMIIFSACNFINIKGDHVKEQTTNQTQKEAVKTQKIVQTPKDKKRGVTPPSPATPPKPDTKDQQSKKPKPKSK